MDTRFGWIFNCILSIDVQVKVVDRAAVVTAKAETVVVKPAGIQEAIDTEIGNYSSHLIIICTFEVQLYSNLVIENCLSTFFTLGKYPKGRCFIRPSGTEDVIRVYAEAFTQEAADDLANSVAKIVDKFLGSGSD